MAKIGGGNNGSISGMIGPVVFFKLNGKLYARKAPTQRAKNSWSNNQVLYRKKVSKLAAFWKMAMPVPTRQVWNLATEVMTGYNLFLKTNLPAFSPDGMEIDPEWLHLSAGNLPLPHKLKAGRVADDPGQIEVTWQDDSGIGLALPTDVMMMVIAHEGKYTTPVATDAVRKQGKAVIQVPTGTGTVQGIYLSFAAKERLLYSPDQYFGL